MARAWTQHELTRMAEPNSEWSSDEIAALANDTVKARDRATEAAERKRREQEYIDGFDKVREYRDALSRAYMRALPSERERGKLIALFRGFQQYCRQNGVNDLPAHGAVCAGYILERYYADAPFRELQLISKGVAFVHRQAELWFDVAYPTAILDFIRKNGEIGGSQKERRRRRVKGAPEETSPLKTERLH